MPLIEEIEDDGSPGMAAVPSPIELQRILKQLSARLALPEDLLPSFMADELPQDVLGTYREKGLATLSEIQKHIRSETWDELSLDEQSTVVMDVARLYGNDSLTCDRIRIAIDEMTSSMDRRAIAIHILDRPLRELFTTVHPMINPETSRALRRPAGGTEAQTEFHDTSSQTFKLPHAWGCYNVLSFCVQQLSPEDVEKRIGVILPPTLTMMDDWDPAWRARGCSVLSNWIELFPAETMKRMGLDKLLLDSLVHTSSLHSNPPLPHVLPLALRLLTRTAHGEKRAAVLSEIVERAILQGWMYAPSGLEGRPVLTNIARHLEHMCEAMGTGILRWLKIMIPSLLGPLQYPPTPLVIEHYSANLSALLCLLQTLRSTGRIARWRGQILDVCARLAINLDERGLVQDNDRIQDLSELLKSVFEEVEQQCPSIREHELDVLLKTEQSTFAPLIAQSSQIRA